MGGALGWAGFALDWVGCALGGFVFALGGLGLRFGLFGFALAVLWVGWVCFGYVGLCLGRVGMDVKGEEKLKPLRSNCSGKVMFLTSPFALPRELSLSQNPNFANSSESTTTKRQLH